MENKINLINENNIKQREKIQEIKQNFISNTENYKNIKKLFSSKFNEIISTLSDLSSKFEELEANNQEEDISEASIAKITPVYWFNNSKIYTHNKSNHAIIFCSKDPLPYDFTVKVRYNILKSTPFQCIGLSHRFIDQENKSYLGDTATGEGTIGYGVSGYAGIEGKLTNVGGIMKVHDILTIKGSGNNVEFLVNDAHIFSHVFPNHHSFYLAANCLYEDEFEIIDY